MTTESKATPRRQTRTNKTASAAQPPVVNVPEQPPAPAPEQPKADAVVEQPAQDQPPVDNTDADKNPPDDVVNKPDDQAVADKPADPEQSPAPEPEQPKADATVEQVKPLHAIEVTNHSDQRVYEPVTRTSIPAGATMTIECINAGFKQRALSNLKQLKALGRKLELKDDASTG